VVSIMDDRARAILDQARETLERTADIKVEHRDHAADYWQRPTPEPATQKAVNDRLLTDAETLRWQRWIDDRIVAAVVGYHESQQMRPITREVLKGLVAEIRKEIAEAHTSRPAEELFYTDEDGTKQDAALHNAIIGPVDHPIDERIMAPIRGKHRARWLAEQKAKRTRAARVIDLPALPLRGSRRG
jgi:hypothetical protein